MATEISDLATRAEAIRLPLKKWAAEAGVQVSTIRRFTERAEGRTSTLARLRLALVAEEHRILAHLQRIHGSAA